MTKDLYRVVWIMILVALALFGSTARADAQSLATVNDKNFLVGGDIILEKEGVQITGDRAFADQVHVILNQLQAGSTFDVKVYRTGQNSTPLGRGRRDARSGNPFPLAKIFTPRPRKDIGSPISSWTFRAKDNQPTAAKLPSGQPVMRTADSNHNQSC